MEHSFKKLDKIKIKWITYLFEISMEKLSVQGNELSAKSLKYVYIDVTNAGNFVKPGHFSSDLGW